MKKTLKLLPVWAAISAVIILAGIVLMAVMGFNTASDNSKTAVLEVSYNVVAKNSSEAVKEIEDICESQLSSAGVSVISKQTTEGSNDSQDWTTVRYTVPFDSAEKLEGVKSAVVSKANLEKIAGAIAKEANEKGEEGTEVKAEDVLKLLEVYTTSHTEEVVSSYDYLWRGAAAVGIVVALIYVAIRFGIGSALTGLTVAVHDSLFALSLLAIFRIPVYAAAPAVYALVAAALSLAMWTVHLCRIRENVKGSETKLPAEEVVGTSYAGVYKTILVALCIVACIIALCGVAGLIVAPGLAAAFLPMLACVLSAAYSSLLLGPALHVHVKRAFDKLGKKQKPRYVGKQKQQQTAE